MYILSVFVESYKEVWDELWLFICILSATLPHIVFSFYAEEDENYFDPETEVSDVPVVALLNNVLYDAIVDLLKHFFAST